MDKWYRYFRDIQWKRWKRNTSKGFIFFPKTFHRDEQELLKIPFKWYLFMVLALVKGPSSRKQCSSSVHLNWLKLKCINHECWCVFAMFLLSFKVSIYGELSITSVFKENRRSKCDCSNTIHDQKLQGALIEIELKLYNTDPCNLPSTAVKRLSMRQKWRGDRIVRFEKPCMWLWGRLRLLVS